MKILFVLSALIALALPAEAAIVRYDFTARVGDMFEWDGTTKTSTTVAYSAMPGRAFQVGDLWAGSFVYDSTMVLNAGYQPAPLPTSTYLLYRGFMETTVQNAATGFRFSSGPESAWQALAQIRDAQPGTDIDGFHFTTYASGINFESAGISLYDHDGTALTSPAPPPRLELSDFEYRGVSYAFLRRSDGSQMHASAEITSLTWVDLPDGAGPTGEAPESGSAALMALGSLVGYLRRRRAPRRASHEHPLGASGRDFN
jgi:hypothetical protein